MRRLGFIAFATALALSACNRNVIPLTPRLQAMFEKTKTICFGRFMVDVPDSAAVVWGNATVPLGLRIHPDGVDEVKALEQKFIDELKSEKAINHNDIPTSHGGKAVGVGAQHFTVDGIPVPRVGDVCSCPINGHDNCAIAAGDPHHVIDGVAVAYEGHETTCGGALIATTGTAQAGCRAVRSV
jgi:uncharacterized Zn-binding protein involved in type VI secretion